MFQGNKIESIEKKWKALKPACGEGIMYQLFVDARDPSRLQLEGF